MTLSETKDRAFPSFKRPPLDEVVCGIRFEHLQKLLIPHIGLLWTRFRGNFPVVQHVPPLVSDTGIIAVDSATGAPIPRVWFISASDDFLIQLQGDHFFFNWRKRAAAYPRYNQVIEEFEHNLTSFLGFVSDEGLGPLRPLNFELSYVNHILKDQGWSSADGMKQLFTDFTWQTRPDRFLPPPQMTNWSAIFPLPDDQGQLSISARFAKRASDHAELILLENTAKSFRATAEITEGRKWFDLAHHYIVHGFADITQPQMQYKFWEREQ